MWNPAAAAASSVKEDLPAPRDLQQSFQQATSRSEPSPEQLQQRIIQLELALTSVTKQHMTQKRTIQQKDEDLQNLQDILHRLESKNQDDQFQEIDEAGMRGSPDAHLHSQQWKSATPFFLSTPVLPTRPLSVVPDAPRSQQPIE